MTCRQLQVIAGEYYYVLVFYFNFIESLESVNPEMLCLYYELDGCNKDGTRMAQNYFFYLQSYNIWG